MIRNMRASSVAVALAVALLSTGASAVAASPASGAAPAAARPGLAPAGAGGTYLDQKGNVLSMRGANAGPAGSAQLLGCTPGNGADNPHYTAPDVSGHGTYVKGSCTNNTAKVFNCLYEFYTDNTWRQKACSTTVTVTAGGGSGNRSNARHACDSTGQAISWRNHEDVDVIGEIDTGDTPYRQATVNCVVN
ncbi:hypothetical protein [Actinoplanes sp. TFC3]|uniref:hypothetical protein n=1 Tax=Actinoplanes sp. TFC3 TaxID=1710355 RepID=UPI000A910651|nr:hypothetical protein [Actinoplanes sp. TFC3]